MPGLQANAAVIGLNRPLRNGQAQAAPTRLARARGIDPEKSLEDLLPEIFRDRLPTVFYSNIYGIPTA